MIAKIVMALLTTCALGVATVHAKDVTSQVIKETDLDEKIAAACSRHCQGNKRQGRLTRVIVERSTSTQFKVLAYARLRNRHDPVSGVTTFNFTISIEAHGTLDEPTCRLTVTQIKVRDDKLGLSKLARREEGKVHHVENCERFLTGL